MTAPALPIQILGTGRYLPARRVSSAEVEAWCGLPAGWAERRSGVRERRWADPQGETNAYMGAQAARMALDAAGLAPREIGLLLNASGSQQQPIPDTSAFVLEALGLAGTPGFSVHATCLSFLLALDTAAALIAAGRHERVLIVSSEIGSVGLNPREPESATLIGDGAAAVVIGRSPPGSPSALHTARLETYPEGARHTQIPGGGTQRPPTDPAATPTDFSFQMDGGRVLRMAREHAGAFLERLHPGLSTGLAGTHLVVPHQASLVGLKLLTRFGWPEDRVVVTLPDLGNCIAASLPLTLHEAIVSGRLERGQRLLLVGTGAGFSLGGALLTY